MYLLKNRLIIINNTYNNMERELAYELIALIDNPIVVNYKSSGFKIPLEGEHLIEKLGKGYPPYIKEIPGKPHILRTYLENAISASYTFTTTGVKHNEISKWKEMKNTVETNIKTIERRILENPDDRKLNDELEDGKKNLDFLEDKLKYMEPETVSIEVNMQLFNSAKKFINIITKRDDQKFAGSIYNMVKNIKINNNHENNNDNRRDNYRPDIYKKEQVSDPNTYIPPHLKNKLNGNKYGERRQYDDNRRQYNGERRQYNGERRQYNGERRQYGDERKTYNKDRIDNNQYNIDNSLRQKQEIDNLKIDDNIMFPEIKHIEKPITINKTIWGKPLSKDILTPPSIEINKNILKYNEKDTNKIEYISNGGYLEQIEKEKDEENKKNIQKDNIEESWSCN
jgi:hypothetical protein